MGHLTKKQAGNDEVGAAHNARNIDRGPLFFRKIMTFPTKV